jgi:hypothetical protein
MTGNAKVSGGLALGDVSLTAPAAGRILMKQSTGATMPPAGTALLYLGESGQQQAGAMGAI